MTICHGRCLKEIFFPRTILIGQARHLSGMSHYEDIDAPLKHSRSRSLPEAIQAIVSAMDVDSEDASLLRCDYSPSLHVLQKGETHIFILSTGKGVFFFPRSTSRPIPRTSPSLIVSYTLCHTHCAMLLNHSDGVNVSLVISEYPQR